MTNKEAIGNLKRLKSFHNGSYANAIKMAIESLSKKYHIVAYYNGRIVARKTKDLIFLVGPPQKGPWEFKSDIVIKLEEDCEYSTESDGIMLCDPAAYPCDKIDKTRYCKRNKRKENDESTEM